MGAELLQVDAGESSASALRKENLQLKTQLAELLKQLGNVKRANARDKQAMVNDGSELRRIDKLCVRYRKENALMREHLESHSEELEQAQQMRNVLTELQQRLEKQEEENELLQQLYARQVAQLAEQGFSAGQKTEAEKLKRQNHEFQQKLRDSKVAADKLARQQHALQLQWSKLCTKRERLTKGIATGIAKVPTSVPVIQKPQVLGAVRLEQTERALKVTRTARETQKKKHERKVSELSAEIKELKMQMDDLRAQMSPQELEQAAVSKSPAQRKLCAKLGQHEESIEAAVDGWGGEGKLSAKKMLEARAAIRIQSRYRGRSARRKCHAARLTMHPSVSNPFARHAAKPARSGPFGSSKTGAASKPFSVRGSAAPWKPPTDLTAATPAGDASGAEGITSRVSCHPEPAKQVACEPVGATTATREPRCGEFACPPSAGCTAEAAAQPRRRRRLLDEDEDESLAPAAHSGGYVPSFGGSSRRQSVSIPPPAPAPALPAPAEPEGLGRWSSREGSLASTLAAARQELSCAPSSETHMRPSGGQMRSGSGGVHGRSAMPIQPQPTFFGCNDPQPRKLSMPRIIPNRPGSPDSIPVLDEIPSGETAPKPKASVPLNQLKPPTFDDEMDDEAMQAEEQAFLARMRAKEGEKPGITSQEESRPAMSIATPTEAAPPSPPKPIVQPEDDFDDVSEVEMD